MQAMRLGTKYVLDGYHVQEWEGMHLSSLIKRIPKCNYHGSVFSDLDSASDKKIASPVSSLKKKLFHFAHKWNNRIIMDQRHIPPHHCRRVQWVQLQSSSSSLPWVEDPPLHVPGSCVVLLRGNPSKSDKVQSYYWWWCLGILVAQKEVQYEINVKQTWAQEKSGRILWCIWTVVTAIQTLCKQDFNKNFAYKLTIPRTS